MSSTFYIIFKIFSPVLSCPDNKVRAGTNTNGILGFYLTNIYSSFDCKLHQRIKAILTIFIFNIRIILWRTFFIRIKVFTLFIPYTRYSIAWIAF